MKHIGIIGSGPTGIYTLHALISAEKPLRISVFEAADKAGVGMPYSDECNNRLMLANIASIEIPALTVSYLRWLQDQPEPFLRKYGVEKQALHERQFLPRILLGQYFRDQFLALTQHGEMLGFDIAVHESQRITDILATENSVKLWTEKGQIEANFDMIVIATGHVWPDDDATPRSFFPSPWSGMVEADIPAAKIGILGTSLSAIDAAMAVAAQHGHFREESDGSLSFQRITQGDDFHISLMSRSGILPEADFFCPIPYLPLSIATPERVRETIEAGSEGLLDRLFDLIQQELMASDAFWAARVDLAALSADDFANIYFADRLKHDPFHWAEYNLREVEYNKQQQRTVAWRYAILRLHEALQDAVPHLNEADRERFDAGLSRVFVDNYAAVPSETIRRLLALRHADVLAVIELGQDYEMIVTDTGTTIKTQHDSAHYDVFIDARGQRPLQTRDMPFPQLREQLLRDGQEHPIVDEDYAILSPPAVKGRVALGAIPYLMHDKPFIQGITASAEIGQSIAKMAAERTTARRRHMVWIAA